MLNNFLSQTVAKHRFAQEIEENFRRIRAEINVENLYRKISEIEYISCDNKRRINDIENNVVQMDRLASETPDTFQANFDKKKPVSFTPIIDFDDKTSSEYKIRDSLLDQAHQEEKGILKNVAVLGMGGIGKTTALMAICSDSKIRSTFDNGVLFLQFGEGVYKAYVKDQICHCIHKLRENKWYQI